MQPVRSDPRLPYRPQVTRKGTVMSVLFFAALMVGALFLVTAVSKSHRSAIRYIAGSESVTSQVGGDRTYYVYYFMQKNWCTRLSYLVTGDKGHAWVEMRLATTGYHRPWTVTQMVVDGKGDIGYC